MANTPKSCNGDKLDQIHFFNIHKDHIEPNDQLDLALLIFFFFESQFRYCNHLSTKSQWRKNEWDRKKLKGIVKLIIYLWELFSKISVPDILLKSLRNTWERVYF